MKRVLTLFILITIFLMSFITVNAKTSNSELDFAAIFENHGAIMLVIDPDSGNIIYANKAAVNFYGYTKEQLLKMNINQMNTLTSEETSAEMKAASEEKRNYFTFEHKLANGELRNVEVYSYPVKYEGRDVLFSVIYDITDKVRLEGEHRQLNQVIFIFGGILILALIYLIIKLQRSNKKLKTSKNEIDIINALRQTFIDADNNIVYLKDENLKYVFVNRAFEQFYQRKTDEIIGHDDFDMKNDAFAQKRRQTDLAVVEKETLIVDEEEWNGRIYQTTKFPVLMLNGKWGVGAYKTDITDEREQEKKQKKVLYRHMILAEVLSRSFESREEQLDYVLHQALKLTESEYGYIYLYDEIRREFSLNTWSKDVMEECAVTEKMTVYQLEKTGIWGEVVRQRKPIIVNDFKMPHPLKKGYPEGHVALEKFMSIPVMIDNNIVAVVGLANKQSDYDDNDVYEMTLLMSGVWNAVERREAQEKLALERNKYLQTLISIGDAVMVVDRNGLVEMLNNVAQKLTGWSMADATGRHYKEVFLLSHEQEGMRINDPIEGVLSTDSVQELGNHAMLTSKNGTKYHLEDSAAPIKGDKNITVGVVLIFRDVTDKKEQRKRIEYLSFHDSLTGLYNRRFFENELKRLDAEDNLPISIIMGDVNGLKLTNDIFGHAFGDILLEKVSDVLRTVSRPNDVIARWGGDEFVLLLPRTDAIEAEKTMKRIKEDFSKEQIKAIKGSISMGADTKRTTAENITDILDRAEEKMYSAKTLESSEVSSSVIDMIITSIHENSVSEKEHSIHVSELCLNFGKALNLSDVDLRKLKEAGFLHDIGKIVVDSKVFTKNMLISDQELNEIKKHSIVGYRILNSFDDTADLAELILTHHEKWDGSGYPKGLKGEEIPLLARIIFIVGNYDRMITKTENHKAVSKSEAIRFIRKNAGTKFDPQLAELFAQTMEKEE